MRANASLVVGLDGSTSLHGASQGLSTPPDRERFLSLHRSAPAIIIGSNTAQHDPYGSSTCPIYVFTRDGKKVFSGHFTPIYVGEGQLNEAFRNLQVKYSTPILIEAGPELLQELIAHGCVEYLYLSVSPISPNENVISVEELLSDFIIEEDVTIETTRLLKCRYKGNSTYGK